MTCCEQLDASHGYRPGGAAHNAPRRNHYYFSKLMDVLQFEMEQSYVNDKRWLLNRLSLGAGVLCGLRVAVDGKMLCVSPGVAVDSFGHEVIVPGSYCLDPWLLPDECACPTRELGRGEHHCVTLCLGYHECLADQQPVLVTDCHSDQVCEAGTVVESFRLWVREGWPERGRGLCDALDKVARHEAAGVVKVGGRPGGIAIAAGGRRAVVIDVGDSPRAQVLDLDCGAVVHTFDNVGRAPLGGVAAAPDGGPVFITHAEGIVALDVDSDTPSMRPLKTKKAFDACVASHGGMRLHAVVRGKKNVELFDLESGKNKMVKVAEQPGDLALSDDAATLYVLDNKDGSVTSVALASASVAWTSPGEASLRALVALAGGGVLAAGKEVAVRFDAAGNGVPRGIPANLRDGARGASAWPLYFSHDPGDGSPGELLAMAAGGVEPARFAVGREPAAVAVAPGGGGPGEGVIAVANAGDGTVSLVRALGLRERLCRVTYTDCPQPEDPCIPLARVELLADGTIGRVDPCAQRVRLLSNEHLLELILCLAERIEECCGEPPRRPPPDEPPVTETMRVTGVEFFTVGGEQIISAPAPDQLVVFKEARKVNRIRITFDRPVEHASVTTGGFNDNPATYSLLVSANWSSQPLGAVAGVVQADGPNAVNYVVTPDPDLFQKGNYTLTLFAGADPAGPRPAVRSVAGGRLDGEPIAFPSGDGTEGGDFVIKFVSQ